MNKKSAGENPHSFRNFYHTNSLALILLTDRRHDDDIFHP